MWHSLWVLKVKSCYNQLRNWPCLRLFRYTWKILHFYIEIKPLREIANLASWILPGLDKKLTATQAIL